MGIFSYNLRSILEVKRKVNGQEEDLEKEEQDTENNEPEENDTDDNISEENNENDKSNNYSMGNIEDDTDNEDSENNSEEENPDETESGDDESSEANNYTMGDIEEDEESDDTNEDETSNEEESEENNTDDTSSQESESELKSLENDIFKDISPEQMNIKIMELKKQYLEVHVTITDVLTRTNKIPKTSHNMSVLEFIINKLMELKDIVQFYLANTFDTKSYVENMVNYQQYLATLNTINRLLKEISRKKENNT